MLPPRGASGRGDQARAGVVCPRARLRAEDDPGRASPVAPYAALQAEPRFRRRTTHEHDSRQTHDNPAGLRATPARHGEPSVRSEKALSVRDLERAEQRGRFYISDEQFLKLKSIR